MATVKSISNGIIELVYIYDSKKSSKLIFRKESGKWQLQPASAYDYFRVSYSGDDSKGIVFVDTSGLGSPICVGEHLGKYVVEKIEHVAGKGFFLTLSEDGSGND